MTEYSLEEFEKEVSEYTDQILISVILLSDCLSKEECDLLEKEFEKRNLSWDLIK